MIWEDDNRAMAQAAMLVLLMLALCTAAASAAIVEHTFKVGGTNINQLCMNSVIYTANQELPGPTIEISEGDTLVIHAVNESPYPLSLHWHGVYQLRSGWNDGANKITQCPIQPYGGKFTYQFNVTGQEGTLWWHAHSSLLRATIYGALIIKPRKGPSGYPFPAPYEEIPILLGEWWNRNVDDVEHDGYLTGLGPQVSDAITINGMTGDQNSCKGSSMYEVEVEYGKTYLLRIINAAVNVELFFKVAGHTFTVVAADASYTKPYDTDVIVIAPGQTVDALMNTTAPAGRYYMAAHIFDSKTVSIPFDRSTATGVVKYKGVPDYAPAAMPALPRHDDVVTAGKFYWSLTGLARPTDPVVPTTVDHNMVVSFGLDQAPCAPDQTKCRGFALVAAMNRNTFQFPDKVSLLEALYKGVPGVYSEDFPDFPPPVPGFRKATAVKKVNYNDVVEVVLQSEEYSRALGTENHPIHLHGFDFFLLAQGLGRFNPAMKSRYNLVDPQVRNTVAVPAGGWAVIRFTANNPGMWFMHCHLDAHLPLGLAMVFEVLNGPAPNLLPPPRVDYPKCRR
uniref:Laccase n=1 Tax=Leersia perrieri TaxID=77586 RepID=A0A0D9V7U3_9ORYZ